MYSLKPCPFCGESDPVRVYAWDEWEDAEMYKDAFHVICSVSSGGCGASGRYMENGSLAVDAWNRRAK